MKGKQYQFITPPADWNTILDTNKENSLYYSILLKQYGQKQADMIWNLREVDEISCNDIYKAVKDYKPKNKLNIIGDLSWGYKSILDNERNRKSRN